MTTVPIWWHAPSKSHAWIVDDVTLFREAAHKQARQPASGASAQQRGFFFLFRPPGAANSRPEARQTLRDPSVIVSNKVRYVQGKRCVYKC